MTRQGFHTIDVARLEVAIKPTTPYNLVPNPSGDLGGWGWITPGASYMRSGTNVIEHVAGGTNTVFMTEPMPITAGHYAAAFFVQPPPVSNPAISWRFEWLNSSFAVVSSTTASAPSGAIGSYSIAPVQAPAGVTFFRLRFDQSGAGTTRLTGIRAATAPTAAALATTRTNLVTNPSFEVDLAGWSSISAEPVSRSTTVGGAVGTAAMSGVRVIQPVGGFVGGYTTANVTGGLDYTLRASFRASYTGGTNRLQINWYDAGGVQIGPSVISINPTATSSTGWTPWTLTATAPSNAVTARLYCVQGSPGGGSNVSYWDAVAFTAGSDAPAYWDGTTAASGTVSYAWTGTAHASTSTRTDTTLAGLAAVEWRNIIGPTHSIKTARESLNVGTLEAELLDANLDPATSSTLRPGGAVRLLALVNGVWEPLFVGETDRLTVTYDDKRRPIRPPRVSLTAVDMTRRLSGAQRTQGVAEVADLPQVLEGAGVPWNVNGSTAQLLATPAAVSVNQNATALDQIALTRDSKAAHAWVDRKGVLVATTAAAGAPVTTLTESRYSDLEVAFSSEACINAVEIEALTLVPATTPTDGLYYTTQAVPYGPFEDAPSIAQWGRRARKFTVHGLNSAQVSSLAAAILARNATPSVTVSSVTLPMRNSTDLLDAVRDLGEIVRVQNTARGIAPDLRVTSVEHTIESEPRKWLVTLGFTTAGSVASPTVAPDVQTSPGFGDTAWITPTLENGWTHFDGLGAPVQYRRLGGVVYLRGLVTGGAGGTQAFALPPGFRGGWLRGNSHWPVVNTDGSGFVRVWTNGSVGPAQSGTYIDLGSISFIAEA